MADAGTVSRAPERAGLGRRDAGLLALLFAFALAVYAASALRIADSARIPLPALAVFFDGSLYLEIARSFPLPYPPEARDYVNRPPGYPALIYLAHLAVPASLANWGALALAVSWIFGALAACAFYAVCRALGVPAFWPSAAFAVANPRWISVAATAHTEASAMLFALLAFHAGFRRRFGASAAWLALAGLTRYPALLLWPALAYGVLVEERRRDAKAVALLGLPLLAFGLLQVYFWLRIPDFAGLAEVQRLFWDARPTWPFAAFVEHTARWLDAPARAPNFGLAAGTLLFYLLAVGLGLASRARRARVLAAWVGVVVLFHVCLSGLWAAWDFPRLAILAWPAALLLVWRAVGTRLPAPAAGVACALIGVLAVHSAIGVLVDAVRWQSRNYPFPLRAVHRLASDEPQWIDFRGDLERHRLRPGGPGGSP